MNRNDSQERRLARLIDIKQQATRLLEQDGFSSRLPNIVMKDNKNQQMPAESLQHCPKVHRRSPPRPFSRFRLTSSFRTRPIMPKKTNCSTISHDPSFQIHNKAQSGKPPEPSINLILHRKHKNQQKPLTLTQRYRFGTPYSNLMAQPRGSATPYSVQKLGLEEVEEFVKSQAMNINEKSLGRIAVSNNTRVGEKQNKQADVYVTTSYSTQRGNGVFVMTGHGRHKRILSNFIDTPTRKKTEYNIVGWDNEEPTGQGFQTLQ